MSPNCVSFFYFSLCIIFDCCAVTVFFFFLHGSTQQYLKEARIQVMCFPISFAGNKNHYQSLVGGPIFIHILTELSELMGLKTDHMRSEGECVLGDRGVGGERMGKGFV